MDRERKYYIFITDSEFHENGKRHTEGYSEVTVDVNKFEEEFGIKIKDAENQANNGDGTLSMSMVWDEGSPLTQLIWEEYHQLGDIIEDDVRTFSDGDEDDLGEEIGFSEQEYHCYCPVEDVMDVTDRKYWGWM